MNENEAKAALISYLQMNRFEHLLERKFPNTKPDVVFKKENFWYCVEVKGDESDLLKALGEIIIDYNDFSHVCICAPVLFMDAFIELVGSNPELKVLSKKLGIFLVDEGHIIIFQEPKNTVYYFHGPVDVKRTFVKKYQSSFFPDETDLKILDFAKEKPVFSSDARNFRLGQAALYKRLLRLEKQGYLRRAVSNMSPVPFVRTDKQLIVF
jgi:hypothetical protein